MSAKAMTGTAQVCEIPVRYEQFADGVIDRAVMVHLDPPLLGDDGNRYRFGAAVEFGRLADVYAADPRTGWVIPDSIGNCIALLNSSALSGCPWTIESVLEDAGYEVVR